MKQAAWGAIGALILIALSGWAGRALFPRTIIETRFEPRVITVTDTVQQIRRVPVVRVLTDTVTLVDTVTIAVHDTLRYPWWTVTAIEPGPGPRQVQLYTVNVNRGAQARSVIEAPGPIVRLRADTQPYPRIDFGHWVSDTVSRRPWYFWPAIVVGSVGGIWIGRHF